MGIIQSFFKDTRQVEMTSTSVALPPELEFVSRKEWDAYEAVDVHMLRNPVTHVRITHSSGKSCVDKETCAKRVKKIQFDHMYHHGIDDISFNFLVDPFGRIYEGRGWHNKAQRVDKYEYLSDICIDIAFVGRFKKEPPPVKSVEAVEELIKYGVRAGLITEDHVLIGLKNEHEDEHSKTDKDENKDVT